MSPERIVADVDGRHLSLSNLGKVLYPASGFTKGAVLDYYSRVAAMMLPHVQDRPVTFRRFPDGVSGKSFVEKHVPSHAPDWIRTVKVPSSGGGGWGREASAAGDVEYAIIDDRASLIWAANLAAIEFHVPLWHAGRRRLLPGRPDHLVFDLDPGPGTSIVECCRIALWISERLAGRGREPGREDERVERSPGLRQASRADRMGHRQGTRFADRPVGRERSSRAGRDEYEEGAAQAPGADRLEPESPGEDDGRRLLAARWRQPVRLCARHLG